MGMRETHHTEEHVMTKAQKAIRAEMTKWASIGLSANILSQATGYAFSTCRREISRVVAEGLTEHNWNDDICIANLANLRASYGA